METSYKQKYLKYKKKYIELKKELEGGSKFVPNINRYIPGNNILGPKAKSLEEIKALISEELTKCEPEPYMTIIRTAFKKNKFRSEIIKLIDILHTYMKKINKEKGKNVYSEKRIENVAKIKNSLTNFCAIKKKTQSFCDPNIILESKRVECIK